jgi:hypothetical protein
VISLWSSGIAKKNEDNMPIKRQVSENLTAFHCRLPRPIKDRLMNEAQNQGISAAMVLTDLIENYLGRPQPTPQVQYQEHEENQIDVIDWLERNA